MPLTDLQKDKIRQFIPTFRTYLELSERIADIQNRNERVVLYQDLLSREGIEHMDELGHFK